MKATVIISVLLILLIGSSLWFSFYMNQATEELLQELDAVGKAEDPLPALDKFTEHWEEESKILEIIVDHEEFDLINCNLWTMRAQAEQGQMEDFAVSLAVTQKLIAHIALKNSVQLNNIF